MNCDPAGVYTAMLTSVAASGYIVIAPNGDNDGWCVTQYKDVLHGIAIAYGRRGDAQLPYVCLMCVLQRAFILILHRCLFLHHAVTLFAKIQNSRMRQGSSACYLAQQTMPSSIVLVQC